MKKLVDSLFFYALSALGISLSITADIGVSSFNSFNLALATVSGIRIGTVTVIVNLCFLLICLRIDSERKWTSYILILLSLLMFGGAVNFFVYSVLPLLSLKTYGARLITFLLGVGIAGFSTGRVVRFNVLKFPIETLCSILSLRSDVSFKHYRYGVDIICVGSSLMMSLFLGLPLFVREGTLLSLMLLSTMISLGMKE